MAAEERTYKSLEDALPDAGQVRRLNLSKRALTNVPPEVERFPNLYHLNLSHNQLTTLPPFLFTLPHLEEALLQNNQLTHLPAEINQLTHLRELYLGDNQLQTLPDLSTLQNLEILILRGNPLPPSEIARAKAMLPHAMVSG
ncbi:MAG: leucine-rich repeat domain-containing protein [Anaerolineales bacterium]|nr:leucine-rich repeat domain-containing protein [Anaerolineales bacterium]